MRSTRPATSDHGSCTPSCQSRARAHPTGATRGYQSSAHSSAARSARSSTAPSGPVRRGDMKKLINAPEDVLRDALEGTAAAHGDRVRVNFDPPYIVRADGPVKGKVGIISGGGSG